jgi:uncharacterized damage-inducible protein DinB
MPPYGLEEFDPAGVIPDRIYTQQEMTTYLEYGRRKARARLAAISADMPNGHTRFSMTADLNPLELLLYNMRHVQHHTGQLNRMLREATGRDAPRWVKSGKDPLGLGLL